MTNSVLNPNCRRRNQNFDRSFMNEFFNPSHQNNYRSKERTTPALTNIAKQENDFLIELAIPGFAKEDVQLLVDGLTLTVKGSKVPTEAQFIKREFDFNTFERAFTLPKTADINNIEASVINGILSINIHTLAENPQLQIQVK